MLAHSLSRRKVSAYVPVFTSFATRMSSLFCVISSSSCAIKLQRTKMNRHKWSSSSRPSFRLSCLPAIPRALMHASHQVRCWACPDATWYSNSSLVGPHPTATTLRRWLAIGLTPFESAEGHPTVVSYASSTILDRFVCTRVAGFRCARCAYLSQDINVLHQVPWQFPSERVVELMSQVCMALTVNFACAD